MEFPIPFAVPRDFSSVLTSYTRQGLRVIAAGKRQLNTNLRWKEVDDMSRWAPHNPTTIPSYCWVNPRSKDMPSLHIAEMLDNCQTFDVIDIVKSWTVVVAQVIAHQSDYGIRGREFNSHWELVLFLLFSFLSLNQWCVLKQVPHGGATLLMFNFPTNKLKA